MRYWKLQPAERMVAGHYSRVLMDGDGGCARGTHWKGYRRNVGAGTAQARAGTSQARAGTAQARAISGAPVPVASGWAWQAGVVAVVLVSASNFSNTDMTPLPEQPIPMFSISSSNGEVRCSRCVLLQKM